MGTYFRLQCKRIGKLLPGAAALMLTLLLGLSLLVAQFSRQSQAESGQKFRIAVCGDTGDSFLQLGIEALRTFDDTRFSMEILELSTADAQAALDTGEIAAYVVVPEGFVHDAERGIIQSLRFVTSPDAQGMVSLFKSEICDTISGILLASQQGVFGGAHAMEALGKQDRAHWYYNDYALETVEMVIYRGRASRLETLGLSGAPDLGTYLACGMTVTFLTLCALCFAPVMIPRATGLNRMLTARGKSVWGQTLSDFFAQALGLLALAFLSAGIPLAALGVPAKVFLGVLPVILTVASVSYLLYSFTGDMTGGVLLQFLGGIALCFLSGCLYPGFIFPERLQILGDRLPMGLCRRFLTAVLTETPDKALLPAMAAVSVLSVFAGMCLRRNRIRDIQGVNA